MNAIVYAIPAFLALMAVEFVVGLALGRNVYRLNDAIGSLTAGILSQISGVFTLALRVGIYVLVYDRFALIPLPADDGGSGSSRSSPMTFSTIGTTESATNAACSGQRMWCIIKVRTSISRPRSGRRVRARS